MDFEDPIEPFKEILGGKELDVEERTCEVLITPLKSFQKLNWADVPMEEDSLSNGLPSLGFGSHKTAQADIILSNEIEDEQRIEGNVGTMDNIEIVSDVGGRTLDMPMLFCSPSPINQWNSPGVFSRIPRQAIIGRQRGSRLGGWMGHFPSRLLPKPWYDVWRARVSRDDWA